MNRVAVTGFGVVSAIGVGRSAFWRALREGRSGVGRISRFDCGGFAVQLAAEVKSPPELPEEVARIATAELRELVRDMHVTLRAAPGVGLAAPQVGIGARVVVVEDPPELMAGIPRPLLELQERRPLP